MLSSANYKNQMGLHEQSLQDEQKKKAEYEKLLEQLEDIKGYYLSSCEFVTNADKSITGGGYSAEGLEVKPSFLNEGIREISTIIAKTEAIISGCERRVSSFERMYNDAENSYYKALKEEQNALKTSSVGHVGSNSVSVNKSSSTTNNTSVRKGSRSSGSRIFTQY